MKVLVIGDRGFIGRSCVQFLEPNFSVMTLSNRRNLAEFDQGLIYEIRALNPDAVILAAGVRGEKNRLPYDVYRENVAIQENVINSCVAAEVGRLLFLSSSAIYEFSSSLSSHIENFNFGQNTKFGYALAKIEGMQLCAKLNLMGYHYHSLILANIYGERDNFSLESALLVPRLIKLTHEAIKSDTEQVMMDGSPDSTRDYLYINDLLVAIQHFLQNEFIGGMWNIGTGVMTSNLKLAEMIGTLFDFRGEYVFDTSVLADGLRPKMSLDKIHNTGWKAKINLAEGLQRTVKIYLRHSL